VLAGHRALQHCHRRGLTTAAGLLRFSQILGELVEIRGANRSVQCPRRFPLSTVRLHLPLLLRQLHAVPRDNRIGRIVGDDLGDGRVGVRNCVAGWNRHRAGDLVDAARVVRRSLRW